MTFLYQKQYNENCPVELMNMCDHCYSDLPSAHPQLSIKEKDLHICTECIMDIAECFIEFSRGGYIFWLEEMIQKYFKKKSNRKYLTKKMREKVLEKYHHSCLHCNTSENLSIDHIKPVSKGGTNKFSNLQILCKSCNSKKGVN